MAMKLVLCKHRHQSSCPDNSQTSGLTCWPGHLRKPLLIALCSMSCSLSKSRLTHSLQMFIGLYEILMDVLAGSSIIPAYILHRDGFLGLVNQLVVFVEY